MSYMPTANDFENSSLKSSGYIPNAEDFAEPSQESFLSGLINTPQYISSGALHGVSEIGRGFLNIPHAALGLAGAFGVPGASDLSQKAFIPEQQTPGYNENNPVSNVASMLTSAALPVRGAAGLAGKVASLNKVSSLKDLISGKSLERAENTANSVADKEANKLIGGNSAQETSGKLNDLLAKHENRAQSHAQDMMQELYGAKNPSQVKEMMGKEAKTVADELFNTASKHFKRVGEKFDTALKKEQGYEMPWMEKEQHNELHEELSGLKNDYPTPTLKNAIKAVGKLAPDAAAAEEPAAEEPAAIKSMRERGFNPKFIDQAIEKLGLKTEAPEAPEESGKPTIENYHDAKSKIGKVIQELISKPSGQRPDYSVIQNLKNLHSKLLDAIQEHAGPAYKNAIKDYRENQLPWENDPIIRAAAKYGRTSPSLLTRLTQEEAASYGGKTPVRYALSQLSQKAKNIVLASRMKGALNSEGVADTNSVSNAADKIRQAGFSDFVTPKFESQTGTLRNLMGRTQELKQRMGNAQDILEAVNKSKTFDGRANHDLLRENLTRLAAKDTQGNVEPLIRPTLKRLNEHLGNVEREKARIDSVRNLKKYGKYALATGAGAIGVPYALRKLLNFI